jgi:cytochrome c peroxidase
VNVCYPGLRNILVTGPYFHDGSMQTLWDVVDHYNKGDGIANPWLVKDMQPLALTESEIDDLVVFLASLTSPQYKELGDREYACQRPLSKVSRPQRDTGRTFGPKPKQPTTASILGTEGAQPIAMSVAETRATAKLPSN